MKVLGFLKVTTLLFLPVLFAPKALAERLIMVDFSRATLEILDEKGVMFFSTTVVLPRSNYYRLPVTGSVRKAEMGPTWTPTPNTQRASGGKYKEFYPPYAKGNAMGHCKISIDFDSADPFLQAVRIHGNGKPEDLGKKRSLGCIRIPDALCVELTNAVNSYQGSVRVIFQ